MGDVTLISPLSFWSIKSIPAKKIFSFFKSFAINLDILFIDSDYRVVHIEESAQKGSLRIISSLLPVQYVLEINAGQSEIRKITPGALLSAKNLPICC